MGSHPEAERCAQTARQLFEEAKQLCQERGWTGTELYQWIRVRASELGYDFAEKVDGHRLGDFPHHKYSKEKLAQTALHPSALLWVLEIHINDREAQFGAFFEDLL